MTDESDAKQQFDFSKRWDELRQLSPSVDRLANELREAFELLCAALWHLELAFKLGSFSKDAYVGTFSPKGSLWSPWLNQQQALVISQGKQHLNIGYTSYNVDISANDDTRRNLFQSLMLGNTALRLAGAQELLKIKGGQSVSYSSIFFKIDDILIGGACQKGDFKSSALPLQKKMMDLIAVRDSFMHGEVPSKSEPRRLFREKLFKGKIYGEKLSLARLTKDCEEVWEELFQILQKLLRT